MRTGARDHSPRIYVLLLRQDDPRKCTAAKLVKLGLATALFRPKQIPRNALVLDPFATCTLLPNDRQLSERYGIVAIDSSWEKASKAFTKRFLGRGRQLPTLLASNPVNYAKFSKLSSLEALAAALYIVGFREQASELLHIFKWGETFLTLNREPLNAYAKANSADDMFRAQSMFF